MYAEIVRVFGPEVVGADGSLNRARLAELAFQDGRLHILNAIVHPAVIEAQKRWMEETFKHDPAAVAVVASALIFEVERDAARPRRARRHFGRLAKRMDRIIVVTAPDTLKIARYVSRIGLPEDQHTAAEADARTRLAHQIADAEKAARADFVLDNSSDKASLRRQVEALWEQLHRESSSFRQSGLEKLTQKRAKLSK